MIDAWVHDCGVTATPDPVAALAPVLRQLTALAEEAHVTRAAAQLGVPQSTLSRAIARWERDLGVSLVTRRGRGIELTRHGALLAAAAREAAGVLDHAARTVREEAGLDHGRVAFAFLPTMGPDVVPRLLRTFRAGHPGVRVELRQGSPADNLAALLAGEVDLVLTAPSPAADHAFTVWPLDSQPVVLAVARDHPLAARYEVGIADVVTETMVGMARGFGMRTITDELCATVGHTPQLAFEASDLATLVGLVAVGLGVALVPLVPGATDDVVTVALRGRPHRELVLVGLADRSRTAAVEAFVAAALRFRGHLGHAAS